jgi:GT2 family glycosyltransferase
MPSLASWYVEDEHETGPGPDMVSGACFMARRNYLEGIGGFDEQMFLFEEEGDIARPARGMGLEVHYCAEAAVVHDHGGSVQANTLSDFARFHVYRSKYYACRKHHGPVRARLLYLTDRGIIAFAVLRRKLRRRDPSEPARELAFLCRGWRRSFDDMAALKDEPDYWLS